MGEEKNIQCAVRQNFRLWMFGSAHASLTTTTSLFFLTVLGHPSTSNSTVSSSARAAKMWSRPARALRRFPNVTLRSTPQVHRSLATAAKPPSPNDPFANGTNAYYVEEMYRAWRQDPSSVHTSWNAYFSGLDKGLPSDQAFQPPPTFLPAPVGGAPMLSPGRGNNLDDHLKVCI